MKNPAMLIPETMQPLMAFVATVRKSGVSQRTLDLVHLHANQINGCSFCVDMGSRELKKAGETDDRLLATDRIRFDAIYAGYTTGWESLMETASTHHALAAEAVALGRTLRQLMPREPEAYGLLALMLGTVKRDAEHVTQAMVSLCRWISRTRLFGRNR
jgi:AhpD family alkylhydroperoxidase